MVAAGRVVPRERGGVVTRTRLVIAGTSAAVLLVAFAIFSVGWSAYAVNQRTAELSRQLAALATAEGAAGTATTSEVRDQLLRVEAKLLGAALFVTDGDGAVLRSSDSSAGVRSIDLDALTAAGANGVRSATMRGATSSRVLVVAAPVPDGGWFVAVQRLSEIRQAQSGVLAAGLLGFVVALVVAWFAGGWFARRLTGPLRALEAGAERIASGEFGAQVAEEGDAEVASLARSFNRMSAHVSDVHEAQKAFVGDVSHEIRTPLTAISGFARALLDGTLSDEAGTRRAARVIAGEAARIEELTQTLLALSQLDAGAVTVASEPIDPLSLTDALLGRFSSEAAERGIDFVVDIPAAPRPLGDFDRLLQCVSALVANALRYVAEGGRVRVEAHAVGPAWRLTVDDDGPGIPADKRRAIFERFVRLDASRSSGSGGSGLGLAISARLIELMSGRIWADDAPIGGARFVVELPAA